MKKNQTFIPHKPLNTPVLFIIFRRLDTTKQVFEQIRKAKPPKIYIAADGARENIPGEYEKVKEVRNYVLNNIDWDCEVKTLFREKNLGCGHAVSEAITWFFENEEMGIILEDDTVPSLSFFWFCEELLNRYKDDLRIWQVSGTNFHFGWKRDKDYSYYFSYYGAIWGWATWRNRWEKYDFNMRYLDELIAKNYLWDLFGNQREADSRINIFKQIRNGLDTWDFQWTYTKLTNSGLSIVPVVNLIKNIGFREDATHTRTVKDKKAEMENYEIEFPLKHPHFVIRDKVSDDKFFREFIKAEEDMLKFKNTLKKLLGIK